MFKLTIIGVIALAGLASAQIENEGRFLQNKYKGYKDMDKIPFKAYLGCGACLRGGYIFCIPGAEGSDPASWGALKTTCYENETTLTAAKLASPWICSNIFSDPVLAKGFCPFARSKCGSNQDFDFGEIGEKTDINITVSEGETCTYRIKAECGLPSFKPSTTDGFEIDNVDYDDDDLDETSTLRMLQGNSDKGNNSWRSNRTKEERRSAGFKAEKEIRKVARTMRIAARNQSG
jgi:hypothetical protein